MPTKSNTPHCQGDWTNDAGGKIADWFAPAGTALSEEAKDICSACPLKYACATKAIDEGIPHGVFGGMDREDRLEYWGKDKNGRSMRPTLFEESIQYALKSALTWSRAA